jgi:hypothetical protein
MRVASKNLERMCDERERNRNLVILRAGHLKAAGSRRGFSDGRNVALTDRVDGLQKKFLHRNFCKLAVFSLGNGF